MIIKNGYYCPFKSEIEVGSHVCIQCDYFKHDIENYTLCNHKKGIKTITKKTVYVYNNRQFDHIDDIRKKMFEEFMIEKFNNFKTFDECCSKIFDNSSLIFEKLKDINMNCSALKQHLGEE